MFAWIQFSNVELLLYWISGKHLHSGAGIYTGM